MPTVIDLDTGEELEQVNTSGSKSTKAGKTTKQKILYDAGATAAAAATIYASLTPEQKAAVNRGIYKVGKAIFYDAPKAIIGLFKKKKKNTQTITPAPTPIPIPTPSPYYPQDEILDESGWGGQAKFASPILV